MGYRSDVKYVIQFADQEKRDAFIAVKKMVADEAMKEAIADWDVEGNDRMIWFKADGWKWYEGYGVIDAHEKLLDECVEMGGSYRFVRIGENYDDIEERYDGDDVPWDSIDVHRSVEFC